MTANAWIQIGLYFAVLVALVKPLGWYMARVFEGKPCGLDRVFGGLERVMYKIARIDAKEEMTWKKYAATALILNMIGLLAVYGILRMQDLLPLNPQKFDAVQPELAFNTAISFATNTNWQAYGGESTMSYFSQMAALA